jgi:hypothetical protein
MESLFDNRGRRKAPDSVSGMLEWNLAEREAQDRGSGFRRFSRHAEADEREAAGKW